MGIENSSISNNLGGHHHGRTGASSYCHHHNGSTNRLTNSGRGDGSQLRGQHHSSHPILSSTGNNNTTSNGLIVNQENKETMNSVELSEGTNHILSHHGSGNMDGTIDSIQNNNNSNFHSKDLLSKSKSDA